MEMSDGLIEKFQGRFAIYNDQTFIFDLTIDEISEIIAGLSALKTVRGIEGLAKDGIVTIQPPLESGPWIIHFACCGVTETEFGSTLPLAVDAAVGANAKGGK